MARDDGTAVPGLPARAAADAPSTRLTVPLNGYAMWLRGPELAAVVAGVPGVLGLAHTGDEPMAALADALRRVPESDRAPTWELAVRHLGHGKPLAQAAGEVGLDQLHADALLASLTRALRESGFGEPSGA